MNDSEAAIKALTKSEIKSKAVWECYENLQMVGKNNDLSLVWIPGHSGYKGNEIVDKLAKKASNNTSFGPEPFIGVSNGTIKSEKERWLRENFIDYWARAPKMKHSKRMISIPNSNDSNRLIRMSKNSLRIYTMFLTGHGIFKDHLHKMGLVEDKKCRFCDAADETVDHLLGWCRRYDYERCILFGNLKVTSRRYSLINFKDIEMYLKKTKLLSKFLEFDSTT